MANIYELITNFTEAIHVQVMKRRTDALEWKRREKKARSNDVRNMFQSMSRKAFKDADDLLNTTHLLDDEPDHREN